MQSAELPGADYQSLLGFIEEKVELGTWRWDMKTDLLHWSPGMFKILGLDPGRDAPSFDLYLRVLHPDDRLAFGDRRSFVGSGRLEEREYRIIRPNGSIRWVKSYGLLQHSRDGLPWQMIGFTLDITDTRRAWIGYAAQQGLADAVRKLTGGQVWLAAPDGTVVDEMSWWSSLNRVSDTDSGWSRLDLVHPEDVPAVRAAWTKALATRKPCTTTFRLRDENGQYEIYASHAEPVEDERHSLLGWIGVTIVDGRPTAASNAIGNLPGALIRAARAYLDLSVVGLAELSGLSGSTIRRMEDGGSGQVAADSEERLIATFQRSGVDFFLDAAGRPQVRFSQPARSEKVSRTPVRH